MKKILIPLMVVLLLCLSVTALAADSLTIDTSVDTVNEGETLQAVLIREGAAAEGDVIWTSSDKKVATVDENGLVTALRKGRTVITAQVKAGSKTYRAQLKLTVIRPVTAVTLKTDHLNVYAPTDEKVAGLLSHREDEAENLFSVLLLPVKKSFRLTAIVEPKDASSTKVTMESSDASVFTAAKGAVTGVAPGEGILTVASELNPEINEKFRVLVVQPVTRLIAEASAKSVAVGQQVTLSAQVFPANATIQDVAWTSNSAQIATVTADGVATGLKKGTARVVATALDGSNVRANLSLRVTQNPESIKLKNDTLSVPAGRTAVLSATVLPANTDNKKVVWSSSDESVATVDANGRVKGIALGTCEITCASAVVPEVKTVAAVTVTQLVTGITFDGPVSVYLGETGKLTWTVSPENASDKSVRLVSGNKAMLTVDEDGTITPHRVGNTTVKALSMDGSNRQAVVKVSILQHVEGVHMKRKVAYIDYDSSSIAGAVLEPANASNKHMFWESADTGIATVSGTENRVTIFGVDFGDTVVTGTTEDGGFQTSIAVRVGDWEHSLKLTDAYVEGDVQHLTVKNFSNLNISNIKAEVAVTDIYGDPVPCNAKNPKSNVFNMIYTRTVEPGKSTIDRYWQTLDYKLPESMIVAQYEVHITEFQIENDWVKLIRKKNQPTKKCPVHQ